MGKYVFEVECDGKSLDESGLDLENAIASSLTTLFTAMDIKTVGLTVTDITGGAAQGQYTLTFEKFWETYRNAKIPAGSKRNAFKQWRLEQIDGKGELFLDGLIEHIQTHAERYHECRRQRLYYPPLPHAERFLKGGNWETEPPPMPATPSAGRPDGLRG